MSVFNILNFTGVCVTDPLMSETLPVCFELMYVEPFGTNRDRLFVPVKFENRHSEIIGSYCKQGSRLSIEGTLNIKYNEETDQDESFVICNSFGFLGFKDLKANVSEGVELYKAFNKIFNPDSLGHEKKKSEVNSDNTRKPNKIEDFVVEHVEQGSFVNNEDEIDDSDMPF